MSKSPELPSGLADSKLGLGGHVQIIPVSQGMPGSPPSSVAGWVGAGLCRSGAHSIPAQASITLDTQAQAWPFHCPGAVKAPAAAGGGGAGLRQ